MGLAAFACASARPEPPDLVEGAICARGGPLLRWSREAETEVHALVPGRWRWRIAYRAPLFYRFSLLVDGDDDQHYVFDGSAVRGFLGTAPVSVDRSAEATFRTHARWTAVVSLDVLHDAERVSWVESTGEAPPSDGGRGLRARFLDDGAAYALYFDRELRLVAAEGPIALPGVGTATLRARFADFRRVAGYRLPFAVSYALDGEPLADERIIRFGPDDPTLDPGHFRRAPRPPQSPDAPARRR